MSTTNSSISAGKVAFESEGLSGLANVFEIFPERLNNVIIERHAKLYNELYALLTEEERQDLNVNYYPSNHNDDSIEGIQATVREKKDQIADYKDNGYWSESCTHERFPNMPEEFIDNRLAEYATNMRKLQGELSNLENLLTNLTHESNKRKEGAKLFN